ncbi:MAG: bacillithiol biosynthesis deacetylase BshB1 [bacterium]|nr:MAG: bacillithiol biosynthesis deacetylase BshB1 [bacterium]
MKVLSIGIHPDDADFGTGGLLLVHARSGNETVILDLTEGELSTNGTVEERREEAQRSAHVLGISARINCRLPDCGINRCNTEQLACLVRHLRKIRPDILLVPYWVDDHPDHVEGSYLMMRARYTAGLVNFLPGDEPYRVPVLLFYPCRRTFTPTFVADVTGVYEDKERSVLCFESQVGRSSGHRVTHLNSPLFLERLGARARSFGALIGVERGEGYLATEPLPLDVRGWLFPAGEGM